MLLSKVSKYCFESSPFFSQDIINMRQGVHDLNRERQQCGEFHNIYKDIRHFPNKFFEYTRMSVATFDYILKSIHPSLKSSISGPRIIKPAEKLFLTLRFLSTGLPFKSLRYSFKLGKSTVAKCIYQTCRAIWTALLNAHMPQPTEEHLINISREFFLRWQFPNCVGAVDGKHFRIKKPPKSGSKYFNYKHFFSIVLQGVADADYKFIGIEVGGKGRQSDGGTFFFSKLNKLITTSRFNMPPPQTLPRSNITLPCVLVGDEAYPLKSFLMRPYPSNSLDDEKRNFNKRLSRARVTIENAYGILTNKWRLFLKPIETNVTHAKLLIKAACLLHNIIRDRDGHRDADFRMVNSTTNFNTLQRSRRNNRATTQAIQIRDQFKMYFNHF